MRFFAANFKWVMLVSGLLTCTMLLGLFAPNTLLESNFGGPMQPSQGPVSEIIVRNWSALIGLMGIMLVYGAFVAPVRRFSLVIAGVSKVVFIALVLVYGRQYLTYGVGTAVVADLIMIVLYTVYLALTRNAETGRKPLNNDR